MRAGLNRVSLFGACIALIASTAWAQTEDAAVQYEVVVFDDSPAETAPVEVAEEVAEVEIVAQAVTEPIAVEGEEGASPRDTTARFLLQFADQSIPHVLVTQPRQVSEFQYFQHRLPAHAVIAVDPQSTLLMRTPYPHLPQVLRIVQSTDGAEGGAFALYYDPATGEQITGEDLSNTTDWEPGEYMIGVSLSVIDSDLLRQHLGIDAEIGLVVDEVFEDSPAQSAGLAVGDILLKAGGTDLKTPQDLVDAVQAFSTDSGDAIAIELIQSGERKTIEVTPTTRQELLGYDLVQPETNLIAWSALLDANANAQFNHLLIAPQSGMWFPQQQPDGLTTSIQSLTEQVQRLQESIDRLEQRLDDE